MKPTSFYISLSVLGHLMVIDLIFTYLTTWSPTSLLAIGAYNLVWLVVAVRIGNENLSKTSN